MLNNIDINAELIAIAEYRLVFSRDFMFFIKFFISKILLKKCINFNINNNSSNTCIIYNIFVTTIFQKIILDDIANIAVDIIHKNTNTFRGFLNILIFYIMKYVS